MGQQQVILLTGGSAGIGKETATLLMNQGYIVYSASRRLAENQQSKFGLGKIIAAQMDVTDESSIQKIIDKIMVEQGRIDAVICNAGNGIAGSIEETSNEEVRFQMETNFFGTVNTIHAVLPIMRKQQLGRIITTGSIASFIPIPYQAFYSASKSAVKIYTHALAIEMKPFNIQCCCILPGDAKTDFTAARKFTKASMSENSPYKERMNKAVETMANDEQNGMLPENISYVILHQLKKKKMNPVAIPGVQYKLIDFGFRILPTSFMLFVVGKLY